MGFENFEAWAAAESSFLAGLDDEEIRMLYLAAKNGDQVAEKRLAGIAITNFGTRAPDGKLGPAPPMTEREQKADRAFKILYWLRQNTQ